MHGSSVLTTKDPPGLAVGRSRDSSPRQSLVASPVIVAQRDAANVPWPAFIGSYRIDGILGQGGMGVVYRGEHRATGEWVAIKTVRAASDALLAGIRREIHALGRIRHPGVARIVEEGLFDGLPYYAMELYVGETLRGHIGRVFGRPAGGHSTVRSNDSTCAADLGAAQVPSTVSVLLAAGDLADGASGPAARLGDAVFARPQLSLDAVLPLLSLVADLCGALAFLHGEGLVHRDLKPENVFVKTDGHPVLVDLGIAASFSGAWGREELAVEALIVGSAAYMAPEQIRGELVDARADLYALGCILYECLTGRTPFISGSFHGMLYQHLSEQPLPPSDHVSGVPEPLDRLVLRLLAKQPEDRIGFAEDVAEALGSLGAAAKELPGTPRPRAYLYRPGLAGRGELVRQLSDVVGFAAMLQQGEIVFLGGESGVGKTRLAMELARHAAQRGMIVITGQCITLGAGADGSVAAAPLLPFRPLLVAVADRARALEDTESVRLLGAGAKVLAAYEPALAALPAVVAMPEPPALPPEAAHKRVLDALLGILSALAADKPLLLLLDDLQWADELSLAALGQLAARGAGGEPLVVIGTYRMEELRDELAAVVRAKGARNVTLKRLDAASVRAMVEGMLALREPPRDLVDFLAAQSDGNPFFVAEYLRAAIGEGLLTRDRLGRWHLHEKAGGRDVLAAAVPLPNTLAELIDRRLFSLGNEGLRLVEWASVLGREIDGGLFTSTAGLSETALLETLETLRVRQIIEEAAPGRLRFVHDKIRQTAYARIPDARRRELHGSAARAIEARSGEAPDVFPDLGHHFSRAGIHDRAALYLGRAADRARQAYANEDAIRLYHAAIAEREAVAQGPSEGGRCALPSLDELFEGMGDVLSLLGRHEAARGALTKALSLPPAAPSSSLARLHRKMGGEFGLDALHREALGALDAAEKSLGLSADVPAGALLAREWLEIQMERISVHYWMAQLEPIVALVSRARPVAETLGTASQRARFYKSLVQMNVRRERYSPSSETVEFARASRAASQEAGNAADLCDSTFTLGLILALAGALEQAEAALSTALELASRIGHTDSARRCIVYASLVARRRGDIEQSKALALRFLAMAPEAGADIYVGLARANLCWAALRQGDLPRAEKDGEEAIGLWEKTAARYPLQWTGRLPLAAVKLALGDVQAAVGHARAALDPTQQRLPDAIEGPLARAVQAWGSSPDRAIALLEEALGEASRFGHD